MARQIGALRDIGDPGDARRRIGPRPMGPAAPGMPGYDEPAAVKRFSELIRRRIAERDEQRSGEAKRYLAAKGISTEPKVTKDPEFSLKNPLASPQEGLEALALSEPIRHAPAYYDPQPSKFESTGLSKPTLQDPGPWRHEQAVSPEEDPNQPSLFNTAAYSANLGVNTTRVGPSAPRRSGYSTQGLLFDPAAYTARAGSSVADAIGAVAEGKPLGSIYTPSPGEGGAIRLPYATTGEDGLIGWPTERSTELSPAPVFDRETGLEPRSLANAIRRDVLRGVFNQGRKITQDDVNQAIAAGYTVTPVPVATAFGDTANPAVRSDVHTYERPDGSKGYLINLAADGSDILQVEQNVLHGYAGARNRAMEKRAPWDERYFEPTPSPVILALRNAGREDLIDEIRTPKDLRRYEGLGVQSRSRKLIKTANDPYTTRRTGNTYTRTVPPTVEVDGRESRAATGDVLVLAARDQRGRYGTMKVDPLEIVFSREIDPDSTAAWERQQDVSLAKLVGELNDKYKTPAFKGAFIGKDSDSSILHGIRDDGSHFVVDAFTPRSDADELTGTGDNRVGSIRRTVKIDENGIADPAFQGLDLPEVLAAVQSNAAAPAHLRTHAVQADLPVYQVLDREGNPTRLFRIGWPAKRNTDALLGELSRVTGGKYAQTINFSTPERVARIQEEDHKDYNKNTSSALQKISDFEISQAKGVGYTFSEQDDNGLIAYSNADGSDAGYLVPRTVVKKGGGNSGIQIPALSSKQERWIKIPKKDWDKGLYGSNFQGVALLSDQAGVRKFAEKNPQLNPEEWSTLELLDAIASYQGADYAATPITGGVERFAHPAVPGVFDVALGAEPRTLTSNQQLLDVTQAIANRAYYAQPAIPGLLRQVESEPWRRRRPSSGPSLAEVLEAKRLASFPTKDFDGYARDLETRLQQVVGSPATSPLHEVSRQQEIEALRQQLESVRTELSRRDDVIKEAEWTAGAGQGAPFVVDPDQLAIPGLDPASIPAPRPNPTPADYRAAMRRSSLQRKGILPSWGPHEPQVGQERSAPPLLEVLARPARPIEAVADEWIPERQGDVDLEAMGMDDRQPMWSDLVDSREEGNAGYGIAQIPEGLQGPALDSYAARIAPFLQLARQRGAVSPGHARAVAETAFRNPASAPSSLSAEQRIAIGRSGRPVSAGFEATPLNRLVAALNAGEERQVYPAFTAGAYAPGAAVPIGGSAVGNLAIANAVAQLLGPRMTEHSLPAWARSYRRTVTPQVEQAGFLP